MPHTRFASELECCKFAADPHKRGDFRQQQPSRFHSLRHATHFVLTPIALRYPYSRMKLTSAVYAVFLCAAMVASAGSEIQVPPADAPEKRPEIPLVLGNGIRFGLFEIASPTNTISVRLILQAGSLDEGDTEKGYAHLLEHAVLSSAAQQPFVRRLSSRGVEISAHANAHTSYTYTLYKFDIPSTDREALAEVLQALRYMAIEVRFSDSLVEKEKQIVLNELAEKHTEAAMTTLEVRKQIYEGTAVANRNPAGRAEDIRKATAINVQTFYDRCYAPERIAIAITGPVDPIGTRNLIERVFSSVPVRNSSPPASVPIPDRRATSFRIVQTHKESRTSVAILNVSSSASFSRDYRTDYARKVLTFLLGNRLRQQLPRSTLGANASLVPDVDERVNVFALEAICAPSDWKPTIQSMFRVLGNCRMQGFAHADVAQAIQAQSADLDSGEASIQLWDSPEYADNIAAVLASGRAWQRPEATITARRNALKLVTAQNVSEALAELLPKDSELVIAKAAAGSALTPSDLASAIQAVPHQPISQSQKEKMDETGIKSEHGDERLQVREKHSVGNNVTYLTFENNVRVLIRNNSEQPGRFAAVLLIGRGLYDLDPKRPGLDVLAYTLCRESEFEGLPRDSLHMQLAERGITMELALTDYLNRQVRLTIEGPVSELPFALRISKIWFTKQAFAPSRIAAARLGYADLRRSWLQSTKAIAQVESEFRLVGRDRRLELPDARHVPYTFEEVASWINTHWLNGPVELRIAGDIQADATIDIASHELFGLSPNPGDRLADTSPIKLTRKPSRGSVNTQLRDQVAVARITWPQEGVEARERYALQIAMELLRDRLFQRLRVENSITYSPETGVTFDRSSTGALYSWAEVTFSPGAKGVATQCLQLAETLGESITDTEFEAAKTKLANTYATLQRSNAWWASEGLVLATGQDGRSDQPVMPAAEVASINKDDVIKVSRLRLRSRNGSFVTVLPLAPAGK
ncbi:hypothetical protein DB347_17990 [Opitutaceae bacterium EW11]|nr:hypothetical protein DB347_17990 [Opitutaceae bacterium EW11]